MSEARALSVYKKYKYIGVKSCSRHKPKTWQKIFVTTGLDLRTVIIHNLKLLYRGWSIPIEYYIVTLARPEQAGQVVLQVVDIYHLPGLTRSGDTVRQGPAPYCWQTRLLS